jgi:hypothetical protein
MKYFSIYLPDPNTNAGPPNAEQQATMQQFVQEAAARGEFLSGGGFLSLAEHGAVLQRVDGTTRVVDGPYVESKELVGGFALLNYASRAAAIDGARRFLEAAGDGECMTYQIMEGPHADPQNGDGGS